MGEQKSDDWLPEGWRVEVRVRKNGKKDKCYFPPSGGGRFYSKLEVSRYLNNVNYESEEEERSVSLQSSKKVVVEKAIPEGLPPGWTKEVKVTKKGGRIRRDPFYIDPVSGYVFRSMKDALRYLETGELGSQAFKRKDRDNGDMELDDDKTCVGDPPPAVRGEGIGQCCVPCGRILGSGSSATAKKAKSAVRETRSLIPSDHSSLNSTSNGDCIRQSDLASGTALRSSEFPVGMCSVQTEPTSDCVGSIEGVAPTVRGLPDKHSLESGTTKNGTDKPKMSRSKRKKDFDLPRRASKRLAGIPLDPMPELETSNRARQATDKQSNNAVVSIDAVNQSNKAVASTAAVRKSNKAAVACTCEDSSCDKRNASDNLRCEVVLPNSNEGNCPIMNVATIVEQTMKREANNESNKKHEIENISPLMNLATEQSSAKSETAYNSDQKPGWPLDLPFGELWQDPCIAFAIKTLTGISFADNSDNMKASQGSNDSEFGAPATSQEHAQTEDTRKGWEQNQRCGVVLPLGDLAIPEPAREVETMGKGEKQPDAPFHFSYMDAWADPCIEFAIKTLTDAIPLEYNMISQDHQQAISSQSGERSGSDFAKCR